MQAEARARMRLALRRAWAAFQDGDEAREKESLRELDSALLELRGRIHCARCGSHSLDELANPRREAWPGLPLVIVGECPNSPPGSRSTLCLSTETDDEYRDTEPAPAMHEAS